MHLQNIATPHAETPQLRYASLHRTVERGMASDEVWKELAEVCLQLGHQEEAVRAFRHMREGALRHVLESRLARMGLIEALVHRAPAEAAPQEGGAVARARDAGCWPPQGTKLKDLLGDAAQFLFLQHMPIVALATTLAFPLVVGLGGFLTAGGSLVLLAAIAALPGLCVMAVVGAMGRRILLDSAAGGTDAPALPEPSQLWREAGRFYSDTILSVVMLLGLPLLLVFCGAPILPVVPGLALCAFFLPMAWTLRQLRGDFDSFAPSLLMRAVGRTLSTYAPVALVCWALFLPALGVVWATRSYATWVQITAIGPLFVLPLFVVSRLMGTFLDETRVRLGAVLVSTNGKPGVASPEAEAISQAIAATRHTAPARSVVRTGAKTPAPAAAARPAVPAPAAPASPARAAASPANAAAPRVGRAPANAARRIEGRAPTVAKKPAPAAPAAPAPAAPAQRPAAKPPAKPAAPSKPAKAPAKPAPAAPTADGPDLSHLPGATIVTGEDRVKVGAAARKQ